MSAESNDDTEKDVTLQTLADEVDDALLRNLIEPATAHKLYNVLAAMGELYEDNDAPVERDGVEFFRGLITELLKKPRLYRPEEGGGGA